MEKTMLERNSIVYLLLFLFGLSCFFYISPARSNDQFYYCIDLELPVMPVTADFLERALDQAREDEASGLIIRLDTPGGLMNSMNEMVGEIDNSDVPVITWVAPSGARAASAGVFIMYSSHVSAMAEGTRMGAAHPVAGGGEDMGEAMEDKIINDALAQLRSYARRRNRSETVAEKFVRESVSLTAREAYKQGAVDFIVSDFRSLLAELEGRKIEVSGDVTKQLPPPVEVRKIHKTWREDFLATLANPNLVYILLSLGMMGLIYEFANPGVGVGGVVGGMCFLFALYGLSILPVNYAGIGLIGLGLVLLVLELFIPSFGVLTMGGLASFILGSVLLFQTPAFSVSIGIVIGIALAITVFALVAGSLAVSAWKKPAAVGEGTLVGRRGVVQKELNPEGMVHVHGELWRASSVDERQIEENEEVEVVEEQRHQLLVRPQQ
ncbi:MAG: NfeD family protein [bacterium]